jgi:hypothetical protein
MIRFEEPTPHHVKLVARSMRARDTDEILAAWGEPQAAILKAITDSPYARTAFWDLEPLAIFGMKNLTVLGRSAQVWCFGTQAIDRHRIAFMRASRSQLSQMFERAQLLTNYVDATDYEALRWLAWLGARSALPPVTLGGRLFAQFFLEAPRAGADTCQQA